MNTIAPFVRGSNQFEVISDCPIIMQQNRVSSFVDNLCCAAAAQLVHVGRKKGRGKGSQEQVLRSQQHSMSTSPSNYSTAN